MRARLDLRFDIGLALVLAATFFVFSCELGCIFADTFVGAGVLAVIVGAIGSLLTQPHVAWTRPSIVGLVTTLVGLGWLMMLGKPPDGCCTSCIRRESDRHAIEALMNKEKDAVEQEKPSLLKEIFDGAGQVCFGGGACMSFGEYYGPKLETEIHHGIGHEIDKWEFVRSPWWKFWDGTESTAKVRVRSTGFWRHRSDPSPQFSEYHGSDEWYFVRRQRCCSWKIARLTVNRPQ